MRKAAPALVATFAGIGLISQFKSAPDGLRSAGRTPASKVSPASAQTPSTTRPTTTTVPPVLIGTDDNGNSDDGGFQAAPSTTPKTVATTAAPSSNSGAGSKQFTGTVSWNEFGPVEVQITVTNGKIVDSVALQYPTDHRRSQRISAFSIPVLNQEAITAQSAAIDSVSGATYTSASYLESLQSAIDKSRA